MYIYIFLDCVNYKAHTVSLVTNNIHRVQSTHHFQSTHHVQSTHLIPMIQWSSDPQGRLQWYMYVYPWFVNIYLLVIDQQIKTKPIYSVILSHFFIMLYVCEKKWYHNGDVTWYMYNVPVSSLYPYVMNILNVIFVFVLSLLLIFCCNFPNKILQQHTCTYCITTHLYINYDIYSIKKKHNTLYKA